MKQTLIPILLFILYSMNLAAQDTIVLDGKKIPKNELNPYNGEGYNIDLTKPEIELSLKNITIETNEKIVAQKIYISKGMKSFLQCSYINRIDSVDYFLPSCNIKFFDEKGNIKWENQLKGKTPLFCYLSSDGKFSILDLTSWKLGLEFGGDDNSLSIFDEKGEYIFEHPTPIKFRISRSRDIICYQKDMKYVTNKDQEKIFYCFDLKSKKLWSKIFEKKVEVRPISYNGDYIIAYSDSTYALFYREGKELFKKQLKEFGGNISEISNDGIYTLSIRSSLSSTSYFLIYKLQTMEYFKINYYKTKEDNDSRGIYNGASFVNKSNYLIALTSIIAPNTGMIIFHNLKGEYIGHKVYPYIKSSFWSPTITLLDDGSFEVYMDGIYLGNLTLPGVNTKLYLSKIAE